MVGIHMLKPRLTLLAVADAMRFIVANIVMMICNDEDFPMDDVDFREEAVIAGMVDGIHRGL